MVVGKCPLRAVGGGDPAALVLGGGRGGPVETGDSSCVYLKLKQSALSQTEMLARMVPSRRCPRRPHRQGLSVRLLFMFSQIFILSVVT